MISRRIPRRSVIGSAFRIALAVPLLAACGGGQPPAQSAATAAPAPVATTAGQAAAATAAPQSGTARGKTVVWFHRTSPLEVKWQDDYVMGEYKKRQPDVIIQRINIPGAEYNAKLLALQAAGETPNIFGFSAFATWWGRGLIIPLDEFLAKDKDIAGQHFPGMFDTYKWWGKRWGMPMAPRFGTMTFYNKDLFDKAGVETPKVDFTLKDWNADVMLEKAVKLTTNYGKPDVVFGIDFGPWSPHGLAYLWGGDTYRQQMYDQGIDDQTSVDSAESIAAHQFKQDLIQKHHANPAAADNQAISVLGDVFKTGRVAMSVQGGWAWSSFSDIKDFKWGVAPVPGKKAVKNSENLNVWVLGDAPNKEGTWEFVKFLTGKDGQSNWVRITGAQTSRPDVLDEWVKLHANHMPADDIKTLVSENIKHTVESMDHMVVDFARFDDAYNQQASALWDGKVTVKAFMDQLRPAWDTIAKDTYTKYKDKLIK
jgi:multiple sugar transport system substrate-binding protein